MGSRPSVATKDFIIVNDKRRSMRDTPQPKWQGQQIAPTAGYPPGNHRDTPVKGSALNALSRSQGKGKSLGVLGIIRKDESEEDVNPQVIQLFDTNGIEVVD